jgi:hypothetical protein
VARPCTVCSSPERVAIDKALVDGEPRRRIAARFGVPETSLRRHAVEHLPEVLAAGQHMAHAPDLARQQAAQEIAAQNHVLDVQATLRLCQSLTVKLATACDEWLTDPDDPARYTLVPRSDDVWVIYDDDGELTPQGHPTRKKARLSRLLALVQSQSRAPDPDTGGTRAPIDVKRGEYKVADPRDLVLKAAGELRGQAQLLATLLEKVHSAEQVKVFQETVLAAVQEAAPDVRAAIGDELRRRLAARGSLRAD